MRMLVTGSSGFLGTNLIKKVRGSVVEYDVNHEANESLDNLDLLKEKLKGVDLVYHLAGISNPQSPDLYKVNVLGTKNLITAIENLNHDTKIIFASTFGVYRIPQKGEVIDENFPINPRNEYGKSKLEAEKYVLKNKQNIVLRFSNVYGPGMLPGRHSVIANFIDAISNNKEVEINDKDASRDFLYITDLIDALVRVSEFESGGMYNICSGEETSIINLVRKIEEISGKNAAINFNNTKEFSGCWKGDFAKAQKSFGWRPQVFIDEGLRMIIKS